ncbi:hypothetical protein FUAX_44790 (plasmid) [Fulvitalea axinellae]|uniref:DUF4237 domain-containing protein n=1 Tax=Fulvitalea axinellae TaxID=1182444 RepID=A0AAU9CYL1_9BACT|nr:hypothetical protein FUAX_44790 [Fulvitalea axinellae]
MKLTPKPGKLLRLPLFLLLVFVPLVLGACQSSDDDDPPPFYQTADQLATTYDSKGEIDEAERQKIFSYYNKKQWDELETLFTSKNINGGWPPANGGYDVRDDTPLLSGQEYDRYSNALSGWDGQGEPPLGGSFTSPVKNGQAYSFGQRALNKPEAGYDFYFVIEVLKDLPFKGQSATVIPWFDQPGDGVQTMWKIPKDPNTGYPLTWNKMAELGYIKITIKKSPSGKYENLVGTVIQ